MTKDQEYEEAYVVISTGMLLLVECLTGWDPPKFLKWASTENPHLGNMTPKQLILSGRAHKVLQFIESKVEEGEQSEHQRED